MPTITQGSITQGSITQGSITQGSITQGSITHSPPKRIEAPMVPAFSLLFRNPADLAIVEAARQPEIFTDLNLDQVVGRVTRSRPAYELDHYFYVPLRTDDEVAYRQEVVRDLENESVAACLGEFAEAMQSVRAARADARKRHYRYQKDRCQLGAVRSYVDAVERLTGGLEALPIESRALTLFRDFLVGQVRSAGFRAVRDESAAIDERLDAVRYTIHMRGATVSVDSYRDETDYSAEVLDTFDRFRQGGAKSHLIAFRESADMDHVEGQVLDRVALLNPDVFAALDAFAAAHEAFIDPTIASVERESQFLLAYLEFAADVRAAELPMTLPVVSAFDKSMSATDTFDIALAAKFVASRRPVVCNDVRLSGAERIIVVSGPNQGGKTTLARTFGQLHYLGSLGLPVPGKDVTLLLPDRIFTHFERGENLADHRSKLQDELVRIHDILDHATADSVVIINEIFTSTTLDDAIFLGTRVLESIIERGLVCLCVTFVDELAHLSETTVSMVSTVVPEDPAQRTFKVVRRPADGLAYAAAIAEKYGLSYRRLAERIAQ